jgi:hypothetical protein
MPRATTRALSIALGLLAFPFSARAQSPEKPATPAPGTTPATPQAAPPTEAPTPGSTEDSGAYTVKLHDLERKVDELKEQIFRSKARLNLLKETVLGGVIAGSRSVIKHHNAMGSNFRLIKVVYAIDGAQIFAKTDDTGRLDDARDFEVFNGSIVPGSHTVSVLLEYQGSGYGVFSYLKGYHFKVRSSHTFTAAEGKLTELVVNAYEKGNLTTALQDRPAIDFKLNVLTDRPTPGPGK